MLATLLNWAQRSIWPQSDDTDEPSPLPFLDCGENGTALDLAAIEPTPDNGIFFERLPLDLRRMILVEAFGGRAVHIDLRWSRPLRARPPRKTRHAGGVRVTDGEDWVFHQMKKPRGWQWYSCVCHRDPVWFVERWHVSGSDKIASHPSLDTCLQGETQSCDKPPGDTGDISRCFLGVMGWLRTCRQAYIEGTDILYSTNRYHLSGPVLMMELPRLLPSKAVSDIHSVEMCWDLGQVARPPDQDRDFSAERRFRGWFKFVKLKDQLPRSLPNLRYLHLTLRGEWFPPQMAVNDLIKQSEPAMLQPLDEMVRKLYESSRWTGTRYTVAIPANVFRAREPLDVDTTEDEPESAIWQRPKRRQVWRPLQDDDDGRTPSEDGLGYWLEEVSNRRVPPFWSPNYPFPATLAADW